MMAVKDKFYCIMTFHEKQSFGNLIEKNHSVRILNLFVLNKRKGKIEINQIAVFNI